MKSGLWILVVVIIAGIVVGSILKGRLDQIPDEGEWLRYREISDISDPDQRIAEFRKFIAENPPSGPRQSAYNAIASDMVGTIKDTTAFERFAHEALATETDPDSRAVLYYWLYQVRSDSASVEALARELLKDGKAASWIYNAISWDLAERVSNFRTALSLCDRAIELATTRRDSASYIDTKGWIYFKHGSYAQAVEYLDQAVALLEEPEEEILRHLAYAALRLNDDEKAFETFKTILILGEYGYARAAVDSLMTLRGYTPEQRKSFNDALWQARLASAKPAQAFTLPMLTGGTYEFKPPLEDVTIINFFAPGCRPCLAELPQLQSLHEKFDDLGVDILVIDATNSRERMEEIAREKSLTLRILLDDKQIADKGYNLMATPTTLVVDRGGRIIFKHVGFNPDMEEMLTNEIQELLKLPT